jgi:hypothetical protein
MIKTILATLILYWMIENCMKFYFASRTLILLVILLFLISRSKKKTIISDRKHIQYSTHISTRYIHLHDAPL